MISQYACSLSSCPHRHQPSYAGSRSLHALSLSSLTHAAVPGKPPVPVTPARRIPAATPESSGEGALRLTRIGYCCILAREMSKDGARSRLERMERLAGAPHLLISGRAVLLFVASTYTLIMRVTSARHLSLRGMRVCVSGPGGETGVLARICSTLTHVPMSETLAVPARARPAPLAATLSSIAW
jgi:hypothetical protein